MFGSSEPVNRCRYIGQGKGPVDHAVQRAGFKHLADPVQSLIGFQTEDLHLLARQPRNDWPHTIQL